MSTGNVEPRPSTGRLRRFTLIVLGAFALCVGITGVAFAFWTTHGTGAATVTTGTLNPPTNVSASSPTPGSASVSWTATAGTPSATGYNVVRTNTSTSATANVCGTPTIPVTTTSCTDSNVPAGTYTYRVTALFRTWTAQSAPSNGVTVVVATKLGFTVQPSNAVAGVGISPAIAVTVEDASGNAVALPNVSVSLAIGTNPGSGTLNGTTTATTSSSGVATFTGLSINKTGSGYTLSATANGLTSASSSSFTISPAAASQLAFGQQPTSATAGSAISPAVTVRILDQFGNLTSSTASVDVAIGTNPSGGLLSGTHPVAAVAGAATFSNLSIDRSGAGYTLNATSSGLTTAASSSFTINTGAAAKLAFIQQPSNASGGTAFGTQPKVAVEDAAGNIVTTDTSTVTLTKTIGSGPGTLSGCTGTRSSGTTSFSGCTIDTIGANYSLTATNGTFSVVSAILSVNTGPAAKLVIAQQPSSTATGGTAFAQQPKVTIEDAGNNVVTGDSSSVTLALTTGAGASLSCASNPVAAVAGIATFAACAIDKTGTYTLTATDGTLTSAVSSSVTVSVGAAVKLAFTQQPSNAAGGTAFGTQPKVAVEDAGGNVVTTDASTVTLAKTTGSGAGTLSGCSGTSTGGVTSFTGCTIDTAGANYTLTATDGGLVSAVSAILSVNVGPAAKLVITQQPSSTGTGGTALATQPKVTVKDAGNNVVTTDTSAVSLAITGGTGTAGASLACTNNPTNAVAGIATFAGCAIDKVGTSYTLTATDGSLTSAVSTSVTVSVGPAVKLAFTTSPTDADTNTAFPSQPVVTVQDAGGNTVTATNSVTLSITAGTGTNGAALTCTTNPQAASAGTVTFTGCKINVVGSTYTLTAAATGLTSATSGPFNVLSLPTVSGVSLANGGTVGQADASDTVTVTFSKPMNAASLCSTWNNTGTQTLTGNGVVTVTITDNGTNDSLTVSANACTFHLGSIALGRDYVNATTTFSGNGANASSISLTTSGVLTITLGKGTGSATGVAAAAPIYTPVTGLTDTLGGVLPTTPFTGTSSRF